MSSLWTSHLPRLRAIIFVTWNCATLVQMDCELLLRERNSISTYCFCCSLWCSHSSILLGKGISENELICESSAGVLDSTRAWRLRTPSSFSSTLLLYNKKVLHYNKTGWRIYHKLISFPGKISLGFAKIPQRVGSKQSIPYLTITWLFRDLGKDA